MEEKVLNNINYKEFKAKNSKDTILILHCWWWSSDSWVEVGKLLEKKWYDVIVPDLPWFWKTKLEKIFTLDDYADVVIKFMNELKDERWKIKKGQKVKDDIILWWHSNGGAIAINIVNRLKAESWKLKENVKNFKIKKLILNNSAWIRNDRKRSLKRKFFSIVTKPFRFLAWFSTFKGIRKYFYKFIGSSDYINAENTPYLKETYLNIISSDLKEDIKNIKLDTLLIWWEKDTCTPLSDWKFMSENILNSKLVILKDERHWIHLKSPKKLIEAFLNNLNF
jgi:pimeloyl-ACP methyl ester carboxylesterase